MQDSTPEPKWYEKIDGIDAAAALKSSGSEAALEQVMEMFYESYQAKSGEIRQFYETQDWSNYTIKVHALKSSSRLVGAIKLADMAEALEMAGKRMDTDFITANHESLMEEYDTVYDALKSEFKSDEALPEIPEAILSDAYAGLSEFAQMKEFDMARMVMDSVREYQLPPDDEDRFERIQNCLSRMDWDGIVTIIEEVLK